MVPNLPSSGRLPACFARFQPPLMSNVRRLQMQHPRTIETTLEHPGTGRFSSVIRAEDLWSCVPVSVREGNYVLFMASDRQAQTSKVEAARAWVEAGAAYVCVWGPNSHEIEEAFDHAAFLPELGEPLPFTLMTTSHRDEPMEEALWFAFYNGKAPDEVDDGACPVVVVVDSKALEERVTSWVRGNTE